MRIFYTDSFVLPLPVGHRFPMQKYARLRESVEACGLVPPHLLMVPPAATDAELSRVHSTRYVHAVSAGRLDASALRRIGFPWSAAMVERSRRSVGATIAAADAALQDGYGVNLAGGTHHGFADRGEGFCVFNDVAVAIRTLQAQGRIERAVVIDLDVHQGNGTASIFRGDPSVFTLSVHGANNFPFHKESSDLDLALPDRATDDVFLAAVAEGLRQALAHGADLAFYIAGADPFEGDRLGRLAVSKSGLAERDDLVYDACLRAGVPVTTVMGGGYAHDIEDTVAIHFHAVRAAALRAGLPTSNSR
jgi:acetoin utilization deacetylase AcuC-like enzyme